MELRCCGRSENARGERNWRESGGGNANNLEKRPSKCAGCAQLERDSCGEIRIWKKETDFMIASGKANEIHSMNAITLRFWTMKEWGKAFTVSSEWNEDGRVQDTGLSSSLQLIMTVRHRKYSFQKKVKCRRVTASISQYSTFDRHLREVSESESRGV